ncbi:MAG: barstar family protein [Nocardioides sp.]|uniref:barstar family protein n=1 Tax=Nocardioides sp. TaxID=35761 RepID=UPI0039E28D9D
MTAGEWQPGVHRVEEDDAEALAEAARLDDVTAFLLDGHDVVTKQAFLALFARVVGAGDDFGLNLDALYDALRDLDEPTLLVWDGWPALAAADPAGFAAILDVFATRAEEAALTVLLPGDGSESALGGGVGE